MRDLPFFTTELGVASLTLREIPYTRNAYILIQDTQTPREFLQECCNFCRIAGAKHIYASGHTICENFPLHTAIWQMQCVKDALPDTDAALFPVSDSTMERWREIYIKKVRTIPNAAWMTASECKKMLETGDGYFVHRNGELLGIGRAAADTISWIASVKPGAGADVLCALAHAISEDKIALEVASANKKAVAFYERLGFIRTKEVSRWYLV